jgi:hydrogenase small subunit
MPGFPDKFMPFMDEPPGGALSTNLVRPYGALVKWLRGFTQDTLNKEPKWRHKGSQLTTNPPPEIRR